MLIRTEHHSDGNERAQCQQTWNSENTKELNSNTGVRQGCPLQPHLSDHGVLNAHCIWSGQERELRKNVQKVGISSFPVFWENYSSFHRL